MISHDNIYKRLQVSQKICIIFHKTEKLYFLKTSLIFLDSVLCQFLIDNIFLLACWFLAINLTIVWSHAKTSQLPLHPWHVLLLFVNIQFLSLFVDKFWISNQSFIEMILWIYNFGLYIRRIEFPHPWP